MTSPHTPELKENKKQIDKLPLISVIVPVFKVEEYLKRCIESIVNQTYKNLEIILVDDGSPDRCGEMCDEWVKKDSRIKVIHKENGGVTRARLKGVAASHGDYIGFIDGDDYAEPDMFEHLLKNALEYGADISHCGYKKISPDYEKLYYGTDRLIVQDNVTGLKDLFEGTYIEPGLCNKLFKRSLFSDLLEKDIMDYSIKNTEDLLMNFYLFKNSKKSVYEDFCPYHYIIREGSTCHSAVGDKDVIDPVKVREIISHEVELDKPELYVPSMVALLRTYISVYTFLVNNNVDSYRVYKSVYRKKIIEHRKYIKNMDVNGAVHALLIIGVPFLCKPIFSMYYHLIKK